MRAQAGSPDLTALQNLLAEAVTKEDEAATRAVLDAIVPGGNLDARGALAVYRNGYVARLTEQLGEIFAAVWRVLGDEDFFAVCADYIARHPSLSYNLSDYGREFPGFLGNAAVTRGISLLPELAGFELAFHDLFHAPPHEAVDPAALAGLGDLEGVRLTLGSTVRLLACRHAVYDVFRHRHDTQAPDLDLERRQLVLLFKQGGEVRAREVDAATFAALEALRDGLAVDEALERAAAADPAFAEAEAAGLFELIARCALVAGIDA